MSGHLNGTEIEIGQAISDPTVDAVRLPTQNNTGPTPTAKPVLAQAKRQRIPPRQIAFMPAMKVETAIARHAAVVDFTRRMMVRDLDFGETPGNSKPALLKPGAEKLCNFFGLEPEFTATAEEMDWLGVQHGGETFCYARYCCRLHRHGRVVADAEGSCNSWESRYRYRWVPPEQLPECADLTRLLKRGGRRTLCEFEFAVERAEITGVYGKTPEYWDKFRAEISAGTARSVERDTRHGKSPAWEIDIDTTLYRIPNPDAADLFNTIQKMAQKRALVAATLIATGSSEFFTQDLEDLSTNFEVPGITESGDCLHRKRPAAEHANAFNVHEKPRSASDGSLPPHKPWKNFGQMRRLFEQVRERVGEVHYLEELALAGVRNPAEFRSTNRALECYGRLMRIAAEPEVA